MPQEKLKDRITWARTRLGLTQQELANKSKIAQSTIASWETGARETGRKITALADFLGVDPLWLAEGKGAPFATPQTGASEFDQNVRPAPIDPTTIPGASRVVVADSGDPNFYDIPMVTVTVRAGITSFQTEHEEFDGATRSIPKKWVHQKRFLPEKLIFMTVKGDSMDPRLCDGDSVVVNLADKAKQDGEVYVFNYGGEVVIKRLVRQRGAWWLFSDSPDQTKYKPRGCTDEPCEIIGRVVRRETDYI